MRRHDKLESTGLRALLVERFADDAWHVLDEAVAACGHLIPPEIALRRYREHCLPAGRPVSECVEHGRRRLIKLTLYQMGAEGGGPRPREKWDRFRLPRGDYGFARGERSSSAKVTEAQVREMRARYAAGGVTARVLGLEYGISESMVHFIITRRSWRHVS